MIVTLDLGPRKRMPGCLADPGRYEEGKNAIPLSSLCWVRLVGTLPMKILMLYTAA